MAYILFSGQPTDDIVVFLCCDFIVYFRIIPESPRWLLTKDRNEDAMSVIRHIGLLNNRPLPDHIVVTIKVMNESCMHLILYFAINFLKFSYG